MAEPPVIGFWDRVPMKLSFTESTLEQVSYKKAKIKPF
jgi:hypothetical protein